ncbi:MAG: hypothetical protein VZT48_01480 [Bulleidia sp.]|nr:hypothetical protein [Bulleidia sp.]
MKNKLFAAVLCAALLLGFHTSAETNTAGEDTGIRINNGTVEIKEDGDWEAIGTVDAFKLAVQAYQEEADSQDDESEETPASEDAPVLATDEDGVILLNGESIGYRIVREEEEAAEASASPSASAEADEDETDLSSAIETDKDGMLYIDGNATGYRLVKEDAEEAEASASPSASAKATASPKASASAEPSADAEAEDVLILSTAKDGSLLLNGEETGYRIEKAETEEPEETAEADEELHTVTITFTDTEGNETGTQELELADGTYNGKVEAPEGYVLVSANRFTVNGSDLAKTMIVTEAAEEDLYDVTLNFIDENGDDVDTETLQLAEGTYTTNILDYEGKDLTITAPDGYVNASPKTITVKGTTEADIIVKKGSTCGDDASWSEKDQACTCNSGYTGDPYDKGCAVKG